MIRGRRIEVRTPLIDPRQNHREFFHQKRSDRNDAAGGFADPTEPHGKVFRPRKHEIEEKRFNSYDDLLWDLRIG